MRILITRSLIGASLLTALAASAAVAQVGPVLFGAGIGYLALSAGAMSRLLEPAKNITRGDSVRILTREHGRSGQYTGFVTNMSDDSISIDSADTPQTFAFNDVSRMYVYAGMESKWAEGWGIGFVSGALIGAAGGMSNKDPDPHCDIYCPHGAAAPIAGGLIGAVIGSSVVSLVGAMGVGPHWRRVNRNALPDDRRHMGLSPYIRPHRIGALLLLPTR